MRGRMGNKYGQGQQSDVLNEIFRFAARSTFLFAAYWLPSSHPTWNHFRPTPSCYTGQKLMLRNMFFFQRQVIYEPLREDFYFVRLNKALMKQLLENIGKNQKGISNLMLMSQTAMMMSLGGWDSDQQGGSGVPLSPTWQPPCIPFWPPPSPASIPSPTSSESPTLPALLGSSLLHPFLLFLL